MRISPNSAFLLLVGLSLVALSQAASSQVGNAPVRWDDYASVEEVEALTTDADGSARETTIWLVVVDGKGYIRTGSTKWGDNVVRDPAIAIRVEGREIPVRVQFIEDEALRERVIAAFRAKYGWPDGALNFVRGSHPKIMQLDPR